MAILDGGLDDAMLIDVPANTCKRMAIASSRPNIR